MQENLPRPKTLYANWKIVCSLLQCKEAVMTPKGQLISECLFDVLSFQKNQ